MRTRRIQNQASPWHGLLLAALAVGSITTATLAAAENALRNGSFESAQGDRPRGWRSQTWGGAGTSTYAAIGRTGDHSVQLASADGADISWSANASVEPFSRYRLSGWIKTEAVAAGTGRGALLNLHNLQGVATEAVTGSSDWKQVSVEFDVDDVDSLQINCLFGGWGQATGKAWFDDLELVKVRDLPAPAPSITVNAGEVGEPMPVEIYSQFIEHLGRCIYGGIWAEMLEDRKFYHPITADYAPYRSLRNSDFPVVGASPWQIVGDAAVVTMSTERPFVGQHSPRVGAGAGLRQLDLGVTAGKGYTGYVWLRPEGTGGAAITLTWGDEQGARESMPVELLAGDYRRVPFEFTGVKTTDRAWVELTVNRGAAFIGTASLMPADNIEGLRADTLALLKELQAPIYRWPGGNFVSGYDWRDGVGDRDRRPPRTNPAWTGVEHNDFGMHEFIRFCRLVGAEPWITVNTGFGDAYSAAAELEYANGAPDTLQGRQRAANGSPEPFGVKYWGIGNEMWGTWQLGYMALNHYVLKQNWVVDKMREVDPDIICISSGNAGPWSLGLLKDCADHMDSIAEHFYSQERSGLMAHIRQIPDNIRRKAEFHREARRELPNLAGKDIRIAMTEWNYWYGPHEFGELGTRYFLKDALGIAAGLHEYARQSDIVASAFYAQTVNVIGCIKTSRRNAAFETTGLVLKLYRRHFGTLPATTEATGLIDAQAAWSQDRRRLTIGVVNASLKPVAVPLNLTGAKLRGTGTRWEIAGTDPQACNDPEQPPRVVIAETPVRALGRQLELAPCSVTLLSLDAD
ncbi:MAG: alpha-N-arabinofuranosidase [Verrucomicrobiales bacterium]|nr:alpha-N-arabinofuranosidase [Verrucomicrobiales bacterium]MCP5519833.1 alpha-N-arabinofuranosidase [Verrucomicrobiales bacterium]MCP5526485.1 alpha-N-arabinofuranosidase [Verrucomicrobiales bacterium]